MLIEVMCVCGQRFKVEDDKGGERMPCTACWRTVTIPVKNVLDAPPEPSRTAHAAPPVAVERLAEAPAASGPKLAVRCLCGTLNEAPREMAGQRAACSGCWRSVVYPALETVAGETPPPPPRRVRTITLFCYCGKELRVPSDLIGLEVECPLCTRRVTVPDPAAVVPAGGVAFPPEEPPVRPSARDYLYWALLPALLPLVLSLFSPKMPSFDKRLEQTLKENPEVRQQLFQRYANRLPNDPTVDELLSVVPPEELFKALPNARLDNDAYLPRTSQMHWIYGGASALGFFCLAVLLFVRSVDEARALLLVGLFSGTLGVCLLLGVEELVGLHTLYPLLFDPDAPSLPRLLAYIFGVGLFEELFKALPLLWYFRFRGPLSWREACLWGMASGAGFGISEGINYSALIYNGISPADHYLLRFASVVTLHAVWSGSVGIALARSRVQIKGGLDTVLEGTIPVWDWLFPLLQVLPIAMTLHGCYDAFVGHPHLEVLALLVALLSFAWLGWQIESCREEDQQALAAFEAAKPGPAAPASGEPA